MAHRPFVLLADGGEPLLSRLDPELQARILMALLGLLVLGVSLVILVLLGGRYVRRLARHRVAHTPPNQDYWYRKPLPRSDPDDAP